MDTYKENRLLLSTLSAIAAVVLFLIGIQDVCGNPAVDLVSIGVAGVLFLFGGLPNLERWWWQNKVDEEARKKEVASTTALLLEIQALQGAPPELLAYLDHRQLGLILLQGQNEEEDTVWVPTSLGPFPLEFAAFHLTNGTGDPWYIKPERDYSEGALFDKHRPSLGTKRENAKKLINHLIAMDWAERQGNPETGRIRWVSDEKREEALRRLYVTRKHKMLERLEG